MKRTGRGEWDWNGRKEEDGEGKEEKTNKLR